MSVNKGIQISGGQITAGAIAVGDRAKAMAERTRIELAGGPLEEAALRLEELTSALREHAMQLNDVEELLEATTTIAQELEKSKPSKTTIRGILGAIAEGAQSVTAVTAAVKALENAVLAVL